MKKHSMPEMKESSPNVTPLIDVVMCLIIFFMLVAKIGVSTGADKQIVVPSAFYGTSIKDMGNTYTLNVVNGPNPGIPVVTGLVKGVVQNLPLYEGKDGHPLRDALSYFRHGEKGKPADNPNFKVIIRGDKSLLFGSLSAVIAECNGAQVNTIAYETSDAPPPGSDDKTADAAKP